MTITSIAKLPDGRSFELTLEPLFDRTGHNVRDFRCLMIRGLGVPLPPIERQSTMGGELATAEGSFRLVGQ